MGKLTELNVRTTRLAAIGVLSAAAFGMTACGTAGTETGTDVEDVQEGEVVQTTGPAEATDAPAAERAAGPYVGPYDTNFYDDAVTYAGEEVTLSAKVGEIVSPMAFTIAGTDDTTVSPLLIISGEKMTDLEEGQVVEVTGTVHEAFDLPKVNEEMQEDLDDDLLGDYDGQPYVKATKVSTDVPAGS